MTFCQNLQFLTSVLFVAEFSNKHNFFFELSNTRYMDLKFEQWSCVRYHFGTLLDINGLFQL